MKRDLSDDDEEEEEEEEEPTKRPRPAGFSDTGEADPNLQLEAMLAANAAGITPSPAGAAGGLGANLGGLGGALGSLGGLAGLSGLLGAGGVGGGAGKGGSPGMSGTPGAGKGQALGGTIISEPKVATTMMDFSRLGRDLPSKSVQVGKELVEHLMTPEHRQILQEESGADVEWAPEDREVQLRGSQEQVKKAQRLLARVTTHCHWGRVTEEKVKRLLKPRMVESVIVRLSPMNTLRPAAKTLNNSQTTLSIGKDKICDAVIQDPIVSRQHCVLELDSERGAVYVVDCSTNGTFLNGIRLPPKNAGKVLLSHGDELLLKDPGSGEPEFGFIVNLEELAVRAEVKLTAPRRLLSPEEMSGTVRDFA